MNSRQEQFTTLSIITNNASYGSQNSSILLLDIFHKGYTRKETQKLQQIHITKLGHHQNLCRNTEFVF